MGRWGWIKLKGGTTIGRCDCSILIFKVIFQVFNMQLFFKSLLSCALMGVGFASLHVLAAQPKAAVVAAAAELPGHTVLHDVSLDPWQVRRRHVIELVDSILKSQYKDKLATDKFEQVLSNFEKDFVAITPMEGMDLQRLFYVPMSKPQEMENNLTVVAALATLGWYDALRFADESGRAEIKNNESFFLRAFTAPGSSAKDDMVAFLKSKPQEAARAIKQGTDLARTMMPRVHYDVQWPASYGLLRLQCTTQNGTNCKRPAALPKEQWPAAFEEAVELIARYYRDNSKR